MKMWGPLLKSDYKFQGCNSRALSQAWGPSKYEALCGCTGCIPFGSGAGVQGTGLRSPWDITSPTLQERREKVALSTFLLIRRTLYPGTFYLPSLAVIYLHVKGWGSLRDTSPI